MKKTVAIIMAIFVILILGIHSFASDNMEETVLYNETNGIAAENDIIVSENDEKQMEDSFYELWEEKIVPFAATAFASVGSILIIIWPVISKVAKETTNMRLLYNVAKGKEQNLLQYESEIDNMKQMLISNSSAMLEKQSAYETKTEEKIEHIEELLVAVIKMISLGYGNDNELVAKGVARMICRISEEATKNEKVG